MRVETLIENDSRRFIFHVSDIHIRLFSRHEEYEAVFRELCAFVSDHPRRDDSVIVVTGDVFHTKIELTPECTILCYSFLKRLGSLAPTIVIAGNHDALLNNRARTDSLTSILWERPIPNLWFLKESGYYRVGGVVFGVNSLLDEETPWVAPPAGIPSGWEDMTHVALYHGSLLGWKNLLGYTSEFSEKTLKDFEGYDFVLLGDIHRHQYMDKDRRVAYAGSLLSQNFGETDNDHGVLCWDLDAGTSVLHRVHNRYAFKEAVLGTDGTVEVLYDDLPRFRWTDTASLQRALPERCSLRVVMTTEEDANREFLYHLGKARPEIRLQKRSAAPDRAPSAATVHRPARHGNEEEWIREYVFGSEGRDPVLAEVMIGELLEYYHRHVQPEKKTEALSWEIRRLRFSHMFGYGADNEIDVSRLSPSTITGIFGKNSSGKSTLIDIITFLLFGRITRSSHGNSIPREIIHSLEKKSSGELEFVVGSRRYKIVKECSRQKNDRIRVVEHLYQRNGDEWVDLSEEHRKKTDRVIESLLGTYDSFVFTNVCLQQKERPFRELTQKDRKDFLYSLLGLDRFDALRKKKDEDVKALRAEEKIYAARIEKTSRSAMDEEAGRLETEQGRARERLAEEQRIQENRRARAEEMIRGLEPCGLSGRDELVEREAGIHERLRLADKEIGELERVREQAPRAHNAGALRDERERLAAAAVDADVPPGAEEWIHRPETEWRAFYAEYRELTDRATEIRREWEETEKKVRDEASRIQASIEPESKGGVVSSHKEWDALRDRIGGIREKKTALEGALAAPVHELSTEIEGMVESLRKKVSSWTEHRSTTAYLEREVRRSKKTRFNPSCEQCLENPLFTERKKLELELETAEAKSRGLAEEVGGAIDGLRRAWLATESAPFLGADSPEAVLEWAEEELRKNRRSRSDQQKNKMLARKELDEIVETIDRYENSRRYHKNREARAMIKTLQESLRSHPAKIRYDRFFELMAMEKTIEFMQGFWTAEPGFREYVRRGAGDRLKELDRLLETVEKEKEKAVVAGKRLVSLYEERGSILAMRDRLEADKKILSRNEKILRDRERILREERESRDRAAEITEKIIGHERDREALLFRRKDWEAAAVEADRLRHDIQRTEAFLRCIDRDGLPLFLLNMYLPRMEDEINQILGEFLDNRPMRLHVQDRDVVIGLQQPGGALSAYLGGMEAFITDLALKMVFAKFSLLPRSNFFIIDEGVSVLDQERVSGIAALFGFLSGLSDHTFLISHLPTIKDFVTDAIEIEKDEKGYSRLIMG
jgi:DNA repair exonuclease SbcCD ATPase subunit